MKSRIVIVLSVTLAAILLVVGLVPKAMPTSPVLASPDLYVYSVPFTCGTAVDEKEGVKPANYATTVNIHNPQPQYITNICWKVVRLFPNQLVSNWLCTSIDPDKGYCIRCRQICNRLGMAWPLPKYITGFVVIHSDLPLDVCGVLTNETDTGLSIDAECIDPSEILGQ